MCRSKMNRRKFLRLGSVSAASVAGLGAWSAHAENPTQQEGNKPMNVLYINTDQQRWDALSCAGSKQVQTPALDRLAREGVRFSHAITPQPMCVGARTAIMTGLSIHSTGCLATPFDENMTFPTDTFDQHFSKKGYRCEYHGRYHAPTELTDCYANTVDLHFLRPYQEKLKELGEPPAPKEGQYRNYLSLWPYIADPTDFNFRNDRGNPPRHMVDGVNYGIDLTPPEYSYSAFVADETIDALRRNQDRPFCITAGFLAPHHPIYVPENWKDSVSPADMTPPGTMHDRRENTPIANDAWQIDETDIEHIALIQARYYQLLQETDYHIGRVIDTLDQLGLSENTLVVFLSDHGEFLGDHGLMQKFWPYRESANVPYIMRLPGRIPAGKTVDHIVNTMDTYATLCAYAGVPCPEQEGHNLQPLVEGQTHDVPEYTFTEMANYTCYTSRDWKYVWTPHPQSMDMLFNLQDDPLEMNNLLGTHPDRSSHLHQAQKVRDAMIDWMESIQHPLLTSVKESDLG